MNTLFKALSHPVRRRIIEMLRAGPMASGDIAAAFDMSWPTITGHLNALKEADLVSPERNGQTIRYRLEISAVERQNEVGVVVGMTLNLFGGQGRDTQIDAVARRGHAPETRTEELARRQGRRSHEPTVFAHRPPDTIKFGNPEAPALTKPVAFSDFPN